MVERLRDIDLLENFVRSRNINNAIFDLDDLLIKTHEVFMNAIYDVCYLFRDGCARPGGYLDDDIKKMAGNMRKVIIALRDEFQVHPTVMIVPVCNMAAGYGFPIDHPRTQEAIARVESIYNHDNYNPFPGAVGLVDTCNELGLRTVLGTHGSPEYTRMKLYQAGLVGKFGTIINYDTGVPKSVQWGYSFADYNIVPAETLVFGDSLEFDVLPTLDFGVNAVGWVRHDPGSKISHKLQRAVTHYQAENRLFISDSIGNMVQSLVA